MRKRTNLLGLFGFSMLESLWAIEASYVAGTLPT